MVARSRMGRAGVRRDVHARFLKVLSRCPAPEPEPEQKKALSPAYVRAICKLSPGDVTEMRAMRSGGDTLEEIGARFGVHLTTVWRAVNGKTRGRRDD